MTSEIVTSPDRVRRLIERLGNSQVVGFDTESAGPNLPGKNFINEYRSRLLSFGLAFEDNHQAFIPIGHPQDNTPLGDAYAVLQAVATVPHIWAHNWKHDYRVLRLQNLPLPPQSSLRDSLVAAWLARMGVPGGGKPYNLKNLARHWLNRHSPEYDEGMALLPPDAAWDYVRHDCVNTLEMGAAAGSTLEKWGLLKYFTEVEMPFTFCLMDMQDEGMCVDRERLSLVGDRCVRQMAALREEWNRLMPIISISSPAQLRNLYVQKVWTTKGVQPTETSKRKSAGQREYKTDRAALERQLQYLKKDSVGYRLAELKLEFSEYDKIAGTYTRNLIALADSYPDNMLHGSFGKTTNTGRLSSSDPCMQNMPRRTQMGMEVKASLLPREGYTFLSADYAQVEPRIVAHFAGKGLMQDSFLRGKDYHQTTADAVTHGDREKAKTLGLALLYGATAWKVGQLLGIPESEGEVISDALRNAYPEVDNLRSNVISAALSRNPDPYVRTILGRRRYIPELKASENWKYQQGVRYALNTVIQGSAADLITLAILRCKRTLGAAWGNEVKLVNQLHDELTFEVKPGVLEDVQPIIKECMEGALGLDVPLVVEPGVGHNWAEAKP